jgi:hypothetical protein
MKDSDFDSPLTYRQIYGDPDSNGSGCLVVMVMALVGVLVWAFH